jgi:hypothetical protein
MQMHVVPIRASSPQHIYVLLERPNAIQVWRAVNLWKQIDSVLRQNYNMAGVTFTLLQQLNSTQVEQFATILWSLWKQINLKLWQQENETSTQVFECAMHLLEEWRAAHVIRAGIVVPSTSNGRNQHLVDRSVNSTLRSPHILTE